MPAIPRQKACIACAESKRRCDKQLPECQRCLDRDVTCAYPQPKRRRRNPIARDIPSEQMPITQNYAHTNDSPLINGLDFVDWGAIESTDLHDSFLDVTDPYMPELSASIIDLSTQGAVLEVSSPSSASCPWFLQEETWVMHYTDQEPACVTDIELAPFIHVVEDMLQSWVKNGYNSFIHRRLYAKGMPSYLQDAFTTLAAYIARTPAVTETILQIAQERSSALARQGPPTASGIQGILSHLSRVQALFVYAFVQLFDGSVRVRASAEKLLPTLRRWVVLMWEAAKQYRGEDSFLKAHPECQWNPSQFDKEFNTCSEMWQLWILIESVRRTHLITNTVANVYQTMTEGRAECAGAVMFTARRGLWEADSAVKWFDLSCLKPPLLVPSLKPGPLISQHGVDEFDDFVQMYWTFLIGTDKMQSWIDRSEKVIR